jgi:hypothetical protein
MGKLRRGRGKKLGDGETPAEGEKVAYPRVPEISIPAGRTTTATRPGAGRRATGWPEVLSIPRDNGGGRVTAQHRPHRDATRRPASPARRNHVAGRDQFESASASWLDFASSLAAPGDSAFPDFWPALALRSAASFSCSAVNSAFC